MNQYRISSWFAAVVSIILILKGLITSISSTDLDVSTLIIANILPVILLYISICLLKAKDRKASATTASVLISIAAVLWLTSLIPGLPIIIATIIIAINFLISVTALLVINWYVGKGAGLTITIIILFIGAIFVGAYGSTILSSASDSNKMLTEIHSKGLQKFIDDHNIAKDDILNSKVCDQISSGNTEWLKIAADMYYGKVATHDAGFNESIAVCIANALDKSPLAVFETIKQYPQIREYRSRQDSSIVLETANTSAIDVIKQICSRTDWDMDDTDPPQFVNEKIAGVFATRKTAIGKVTQSDVADLKQICLDEMNK